MKEYLDGQINISRTTSNVGDAHVRIEIIDKASGIRVTEINIAMEEFANALTGLGARPIQFSWSPVAAARVGSVCERKHEVIIVPRDLVYDWRRDGSDPDPALRALLAPYEIDGWEGETRDLVNGHRSVRGVEGGQRVVFFRYVNAETGRPI